MKTLARTAAFACALALAACGRGDEAPAAAGKPVVVTPVSVRAVDERIEASGELLAKQHADVAAQVGGEITEIRFEEGQAVAEGDVVMEIDPEKRKLELSRAQAGVEGARAALAEAERELGRVKALAQTNVASQTRLDQAQTALQTAASTLQAARAELGVAERALRDASVRARFSGLMSRRDVSPGEFVREGQTLFELVSLDPIEVEFHLPEADAARVALGMQIDVGVAPYPGETFRATVHVISPTIDRRTRTLRVRALIDNADGRLRPGLFARANLGVALREGVILVPEEAVQQRADGAVVFRVLDGNRVERLLVTLGAMRDGEVEIRSGLAQGDRVVSRGHADLVDGSLISPRRADGTPLEGASAAEVSAAPVTAVAR
jgi:membrane fusion protein (multidrug efflux system)